MASAGSDNSPGNDAVTRAVSFEFFPPNTPKMEAMLHRSLEKLAPLGPRFVSVTYGADGTTRERTHEVIAHILRVTELVPAAHLTCVGAPRADVDEVIRSYQALGVHHIVALRGDPPEGVGGAYTPHPEGYKNAADLVSGVKAIGDFEISVSAYPEKHPESPSFETDFDMLKSKIDNGADRAITQFFFDNEAYLRFIDEAARRGIAIPIVPGIIPIVNFKRVASFAEKCGTSIPPELVARFDGLDDNPDAQRQAGIDFANEQITALREHGISEFHFYTLNRWEMVRAICDAAGHAPAEASAREEHHAHG